MARTLPAKTTAEGDGPQSVRERILATARELFYREGARAVGVDTVVAASGVAKTSLYRWFPSKDALIAAVLEEEAKDRWDGWDVLAERAGNDPMDILRAELVGITKFVNSSRYRGCPFMNLTAEFADEQHPARAIGKGVTEELRRRLRALVDRLEVRDPAQLTDQLVLLIDGAFSTSHLLGKNGPQNQLLAAAEALVQAHKTH